MTNASSDRLSYAKFITALSIVLSVLTSACEPGVNPVDELGECETALPTMVVKNLAGEKVKLSLAGPKSLVYSLLDTETKTVSLKNGTYDITATGVTSGEILASQTRTLDCDRAYDLVIKATGTPQEPTDATLIVVNDTQVTIVVNIDGNNDGLLLAGESGNFSLTEGTHSIEVHEEATDIRLIYEESFYFAVGTSTSWSASTGVPH